ncbi:MAG: GT4 family glycosyltransferase PelF [Lachnospiraceae bacterium]
MRICLICEGSYPYVQGGVSSWVQMICNQMKDTEFVIWSLATTKEEMKEYKYTLPENIKEVHTFYLGEDKFRTKKREIRLDEKDRKVLENMVVGDLGKADWRKTLAFIQKYRNDLVDVVMGEDFYEICLAEYKERDSTKVFHQFLWNYRSMYFPVIGILNEEIPKADIYHSLSTGYAGLLGSCASFVEQKPFLLSEHGIYTREREEDIIRSNWVDGAFKKTWIRFFRRLSYVAYNQASLVTTLFEVNKTLQVDLGCPVEKIQIIPNGVDPNGYEELTRELAPPKSEGVTRIGAILRIVPIKDVKTMLLSYEIVKSQDAGTQLYLMGNYEEDPQYYQECLKLILDMNIQDVVFTGQVNIKDYLASIDILLLSSISEGQPLALLEGLAAGIPFVTTNVGHCRGILEGDGEDSLGSAGYVVPVMNSVKMAKATLDLIRDPLLRKKMGETGKQRVKTYYSQKSCLDRYDRIYHQLNGG